MGNVEFVRISPEYITSQHTHFLEAGAHDFGGMISVTSVLKNYDERRDVLIEINNTEHIIGCIYLTVTHQDMGKILTSILLGAYGLSDWYDDLKDFYYELAKKSDCDQFVFMGRRGFKKYFSELTEVATVFRVDLK